MTSEIILLRCNFTVYLDSGVVEIGVINIVTIYSETNTILLSLTRLESRYDFTIYGLTIFRFGGEVNEVYCI